MHAAPPDLAVFDELLALNFRGDRAASKAFASALDRHIGCSVNGTRSGSSGRHE
jgi:hypothetical protein